ncbi:hypothetical protein NW768_007985 [Fusarium equiseti]|uniref:Uncharacterized protein n=1 Tax=Fusarium equiseti TaxID=61235 RepID=A0ABQ8R5G6_FUSEQ|nr:hypothetical protein NW768_007985 [Fusarium equiseti]
MYILRRDLCTESRIIGVARYSLANDTRLNPDGGYLNLLVRQFGIDTEVLPNASNRFNLQWWRNTFRRSTCRRRLDPLVVQLLDDINRLLELQRQAHQDGRRGDLSVRARDYRIYHRIARLSRLDGNRELIASIAPLLLALRA